MELLDLLFTLLNFFLFVLAFGWIIYRYRGTILEEIAYEKEQHNRLIEIGSELKGRLKEVDGQWKDQENLEKNLAKKVAMWRESFDAAAQREHELRVARHGQLIERYKKQSLLRTGQRTQARIMPHAVAQARLELYELFSNDGPANRYIDKILTDLAGS